MTAEEKKVIFASSLGTVFEWYDFICTALAAVIGEAILCRPRSDVCLHFRAFCICCGFLVRPFGALVFGRLGDMIAASTPSW